MHYQYANIQVTRSWMHYARRRKTCVNVKTRVRQGIVSAHRGRLCAAFPGSSGGNTEHRKHNTTQHNTHTHTHTHTHGEETKGKETLIRYYASSASWTATTTCVRQASGVDTVVTEEWSWFSIRSYGLKLHFRFSSPSIFTVIWVQHYITLHYMRCDNSSNRTVCLVSATIWDHSLPQLLLYGCCLIALTSEPLAVKNTSSKLPHIYQYNKQFFKTKYSMFRQTICALHMRTFGFVKYINKVVTENVVIYCNYFKFLRPCSE